MTDPATTYDLNRYCTRDYEKPGSPTTRIGGDGKFQLNCYRPIDVPGQATIADVGQVRAMLAEVLRWAIEELDVADLKEGDGAPCAAESHRDTVRELIWVAREWLKEQDRMTKEASR